MPTTIGVLGFFLFVTGCMILMKSKRPDDPGRRTAGDFGFFLLGVLLVQLAGGIAWRGAFS